jgi:hypothetical protein
MQPSGRRKAWLPKDGRLPRRVGSPKERFRPEGVGRSVRRRPSKIFIFNLSFPIPYGGYRPVWIVLNIVSDIAGHWRN